MKTPVIHWILALSLLFTFALASTSKPAEQQVMGRSDSEYGHHYWNYHHQYDRNQYNP